MKSTVEPLEGNKVKVSVEVDEDEIDKAIDDAFRKIAREVRLPGFRPGKAPRKVLEARLGRGVGRAQALQDALPDFYVAAVKEHDVDVIDAPEIEITGGEEDGPVTFDAVVAVRPVVAVGGYRSLRVTVPSPNPTDEEIDAGVTNICRCGTFARMRAAIHAAAAASATVAPAATDGPAAGSDGKAGRS